MSEELTPRPLLIGNEWVTTRAGGLNRYLADLVVGLQERGAAPRAVVVGDAPPGGAVVGVSHVRAPLPVRLAAVRRHAARLASSVDVVDAHFALYALLPLTTTSLRRLPLVVHFQGPWAEESRLGRGEGRLVVAAKRAVEAMVYRRAEAVIVLSGAFGRLVAERYGVDPSRVVVVSPGVDLNQFRPGDRATARHGLGLSSGALVAVCVRRLDARMGLDVLLDAWATVQSERGDVVLIVVGEGHERGDLERRRAALPRPEDVRLLGRVPDADLVVLYQAADCSLVPTRALEGFGLVTLESAACGTPPIVTDVGGLPDGVSGLDPSLVVPAGDPGALARRILAAAGGERPSRAACRAHAERFSWDEVARRHLEIYDQVLRAQRPLLVAYLGHSAVLSGGELALARMLPALAGVDPVVLIAEDGPLIGRLRAEGIAVEVVPMPERARQLRRDGVRPGRLPLSTIVDTIRYVFRLTRRLRRLRPDIVHTNTLKAAVYGGLAGRLAGVPVVWHVRDRIDPDYLPRSAVRLIRALGRVLPTAVVANSETTLATVRARRGTIADVVASAVASHPEAGTPARAPLEDRPFTVGMVGRLAPWKGQDLFLRAFADAFPDGQSRATVVGASLFGEGEWAASLPKLAAALGIADRVEIVGFRDDVEAELAKMDVLVHASTIPEPFGQVVIEAMAAGVAVVAPDAGGPAEVITDGVEGLLYPMGDVDALADHLRRLAQDAGLRSRLGEAGIRRAQDFTPDKVADKIMAVYEAVLVRSAGSRLPWRHRRTTGLPSRGLE